MRLCWKRSLVEGGKIVHSWQGQRQQTMCCGDILLRGAYGYISSITNHHIKSFELEYEDWIV